MRVCRVVNMGDSSLAIPAVWQRRPRENQMNRRSFFLAYTVTNSSVSMLAGRPLQSWVPCSYRKIHRSLMDFIFLLPSQVCMFLWRMDVPFRHRIEQDTYQTPVYLQQLGWLWGQREGREPLLCSVTILLSLLWLQGNTLLRFDASVVLEATVTSQRKCWIAIIWLCGDRCLSSWV